MVIRCNIGFFENMSRGIFQFAEGKCLNQIIHFKKHLNVSQ